MVFALLFIFLSWMTAAVHFFEVGNAHLSIDLGRIKGGMSQEFLDMADIGVVPEHERRTGVPEGVRRDRLFDLCFVGAAFDDLPDHVL